MSASASSRVSEVLHSGMIGEGPQVNAFQAKLTQLFKNTKVVPLSSGTSSLVLALRLAGVKSGDEVISCPFTMIATSSAILQVGANIKWCDVDLDTFCADVADIKHQISDKTRAILVTCVAGMVPNGLDELKELGIPVIFDCAHGLCTTYKNRHISHWADYCSFSFQSIKHLTTGDGGAITVSSDADFDNANKLKWFGIDRNILPEVSRLNHQMNSDVEDCGYKFHMNDISAAIGIENISVALKNVEKSRNNANFYMKELNQVPGIELPKPIAQSHPSWWVFGFMINMREELILALESEGITSSPLWTRNDRYTAFRVHKQRNLPNLDRLSKEILFVPNGWWVTTADRKKIVTIIKSTLQ